MKHLAKDDKSHEAVAVAARSEEDARAFAEKHSIPRHYGNYADLAKDDGIGKYRGTIPVTGFNQKPSETSAFGSVFALDAARVRGNVVSLATTGL